MYKLAIVDDESWILAGLKTVVDWNSAGFEVVASFSNGMAAEAWLKDHPVDVLLSDIRMPRKNGLELVEALRNMGQTEMEVVYLSGYEDFHYAKKALQLMACDYLLKPTDPETILGVFARVKARLDQKKESEEMEVDSVRYHALLNQDAGPDAHRHLCRNVMDFICQNYASPLTVQHLAEEFSLSANYLGTVFRNLTRMGLKDFLNMVRIEEAQRLMQSGRYRLYEVARMVGFNNYDYFRKLYKKHKEEVIGS